MVNEEKVRLMTKLAVFEENKGKKTLSIGDYYRSDFISKNLLSGFIAGTIAYFLLFAIWALHEGENLVQSLLELDFGHIIFLVIVFYGIFMVLYLTICYLVGDYRYRRSVKSLKAYKKALKRLENM
ncbi:MAG: hypothetical protein IKX99_07130 [Lachnospiraceae bacterium]|nr:hypothetical protein [Lachnospiraceae bacterium]MBO4462372.1 hypothetical protein [Lachnospiraceae bacterium]MBR4795323.1 hypothetical protein [Lachnospiraceae bacterium]MBR5789859.1 hypothetical protein [Lachnospiraceae bacterium]